MNALLISDLHLTSNPRDEYRWALFDWLLGAIPQLEVRHLFILGDLTDAKDYHSARLVNRIVSSLLTLFRRTPLHGVFILRGNHDGIDPTCPYFQFLGEFPSITYCDTPGIFLLPGFGDIAMLPHTNNPAEDWKDVGLFNADIIMMHATVQGAVAENGIALDGISQELFRNAHNALVYSGDIHVPQNIGRVQYVGAPYPVRFGDSFEPRAILLSLGSLGGAAESIPIPHIRRHKLVFWPTQEFFAEFWDDVHKGDQVKVVVRLRPSEYGDWQEVKANCQKICKDIGAELCGLELEKVQEAPLLRKRGEPARAASVGRTPEQVLAAFGEANKLEGEVLRAGGALLKAVAIALRRGIII